MTTKEFIIEKNRIVKRVTRVTLVPEDQIVDEPKVYYALNHMIQKQRRGF